MRASLLAVMVTALCVLVSQAWAQPADWSIQTKIGVSGSHDDTTPPFVFNNPNYITGTNHVTVNSGSSYGVDPTTYKTRVTHCEIKIDVTITATYMGPRPVPFTEVPLNLRSDVAWNTDVYAQSPAGQAQVNDYFNSTTQPCVPMYGFGPFYYASHHKPSHRVVRVPVNSEGIATLKYSVTIQLTSPPESYDHSMLAWMYEGLDLQVDVDRRSVAIQVPGHEGNMRKELIPGAAPIQFYAPALGQMRAVGAPYAPARAVSQLPAPGILDYHRDLDIGLPVGKVTEGSYAAGNSNFRWEEPSTPVSVTYLPSVTQLFTGNEHYRWNESLYGKSLSADLPRLISVGITPWGIDSLPVDYRQPFLVKQSYFGRSNTLAYEHNDRAKNDTVGLHYEWNDGAQADASVTTHLHQSPVDDWVLLGAISEPQTTKPYIDLRFEAGEDAVPNSGDSYWSVTGNPFPQKIVLQPSSVNWIQVESAAAAGFALAGTVMTGPVGAWVGFAAAILGESTNFTSPPSPTTQAWSYTFSPAGADSEINKAKFAGHVTPSNYAQMLILAGPEDAYYKHVRWHVDGRPNLTKRYYLGDKWGPNGYLGQTVENRSEYEGNPLQGGPLLYRFDFPELRSTGPGGSSMGASGGEGGGQ